MNSSDNYINRLLSWGLLIGVLAWTFWYVLAGMGNMMDPLYWLHKYTHAEGGWMACGTIMLGHLCTTLFGSQLLPLRVVGWLSVVAAIALPYITLLTKEQRRNNIHWLALAYALMNYGAFQEFSPGTLTVLCLSITWVVAMRYARSEYWGWLLGLGLITAVAVLIRFPNILIMPIVLGLLFARPTQTIAHRLRHAGLYLLIAALVTAALYLCAYQFVQPAYMDAAMGSHDMGRMIESLWTKGALLVLYLLLWIGVLFIPRIVKEHAPAAYLLYILIAAGVAVGLVIVYYVNYATKTNQWYNIDLTYMVSALCVVVAALSKRKELYWGITFLVVATLGTDTAWLKLFPAVLCVLPMAAVHYTPSIQRYLWPAVALLAMAVMVRFSINSVGNCNLRLADTRLTTAPYEGIYVSAKNAEWVEQITNDYNTYADSTNMVLAVGEKAHVVRAITGCKAAMFNEFWSNIFDAVYTKKYKDIIVAHKPIVICTFTPTFKTKPTYKDKQSAFEQMLREEGYREIDRTEYKYTIYIPTDDKEI